MKTDSKRNGNRVRLKGGAGGSGSGRPLQQPAPQWKGLTRDSKVNPDVLLLLISLADEWEGKITGASQGGPVCCPATQALPHSPPQLRQPQQRGDKGEAVSRGGGFSQRGGKAVCQPPRGFSVPNKQQAGALLLYIKNIVKKKFKKGGRAPHHVGFGGERGGCVPLGLLLSPSCPEGAPPASLSVAVCPPTTTTTSTQHGAPTIPPHEGPEDNLTLALLTLLSSYSHPGPTEQMPFLSPLNRLDRDFECIMMILSMSLKNEE
ncbi:hypothetical protein NQZ68_026976 [Dissostichus eleginoides]|nr:hypothetical protein NQZ68_026976 [Dissostichus eleginoides]